MKKIILYVLGLFSKSKHMENQNNADKTKELFAIEEAKRQRYRQYMFPARGKFRSLMLPFRLFRR
jgi:hypothetical protein